MKLPNEGKKLQWSKSSQIAFLFVGFVFFPVRGGTLICSPDFIFKYHTTIGFIAETTLKFYKQHQL